MDLSEYRRAIAPLLTDGAEDAIASYYAFHHPIAKTNLFVYPAGATRATGYLAFSRTGIDLFRPFITLRLPISDLETSADILYAAMPPGTAVIVFAPSGYSPLLHALLDIQSAETLRLYALPPHRFEPIINVLVAETTGPNGLPRFIVRSQASGEVVAAAGLNWQSPRYAEITVTTESSHRRQGLGQSVLAAMVQHVLQNGRSPLYLVADHNSASIQLAQTAGFRDTGADKILLQGSLKARP